MSGSELTRAADLYTVGADTFRADTFNYVIDGAASVFDFSSTGSKVAVAVGVVLLGGAVLVSSPTIGTGAAIVAGALIIGTAVYGAGKMIKNAIEVVTADMEPEYKQNLRELGEAVAITVTSAPFVPRGVAGIRSGVDASFGARAVASKEAAEQAMLHAKVSTARAAAPKTVGKGTEAELAALLEQAMDGQTLKPGAFTVRNEAEAAKEAMRISQDLYGPRIVGDAEKWMALMELGIRNDYALTSELVNAAEAAGDFGFSGGSHWSASRYIQKVWIYGDDFVGLSGAGLPVVQFKRIYMPAREAVGIGTIVANTVVHDREE